MKRFILGFYFAFQGILNTLKSERNMRVHFLVALLVILAGFYFGLAPLEWLLVGLSISLVIGFELINTAIERVCDLINTSNHPLAKAAKDASAGAVLVAAGFALLVGYLIFFPRLVTLVSGGV